MRIYGHSGRRCRHFGFNHWTYWKKIPDTLDVYFLHTLDEDLDALDEDLDTLDVDLLDTLDLDLLETLECW